MVSIDGVEEGCAAGLQTLGGWLAQQFEKAREIARIQTLEGLQGCFTAFK